MTLVCSMATLWSFKQQLLGQIIVHAVTRPQLVNARIVLFCALKLLSCQVGSAIYPHFELLRPGG